MNEYEENVLEKEEVGIDVPKMWKVLLINDNYTPMHFVVIVLMTIFKKTESDAERITMKVHREGQAVVGVYSFDIAETKVKQVENLANKGEYPLQCVMEEE